MECRRINLRFKRSLKSDEQDELISCFKGFIDLMREGLVKRMDSLNKASGLLEKVGAPNQAKLIQMRIQSFLMTTIDKDGKPSSEFDRYFSLHFEEAKPTDYTFYYAYPQSLYDGGISKKVKILATTNEFKDKVMFKDLLKFAKMDSLLDTIEVSMVERELEK